MKHKCHVGFKDDMIVKINNFGDQNNIKTFSSSVNKLVEIGLKNLELEDLSNKLDKVIKENRYMIKIIKQTYSDSNLLYHTNINYNDELKKIDKDFHREIMND